MGLVDRLREPEVIRGDDRWRWGKLEIELRDKGSKWNRSWQANWGDRYRIIEFSRLKFGAGFHLFEGHTSLSVFGFWFKLPIKAWRSPHEILETWGFSVLDKAIHLNWGKHTKIIYLPWDFQHIDAEHKVLLADGKTWQVYPRWGMGKPNPDEVLDPIRWRGVHPYRYMLRSGKVQEVTATVTVERRQWRRRWLPVWFPLFKIKRTTIDVKFSGEVGERTGSWKGGTIGCGYEMKPGDRPIDTLKRMERERVFD